MPLQIIMEGCTLAQLLNNLDKPTCIPLMLLKLIIHPSVVYSQTWLQSHCLQHQPLYNNTHGRNGFNGLCTKCPGYNNNLVITAHFSGTKGVVVNKFDCISFSPYISTTNFNSAVGGWDHLLVAVRTRLSLYLDLTPEGANSHTNSLFITP